MIRFCRGHRNPKRKRGNRLNASLTLRISIDFGRAKYNEIGGCCLRSAPVASPCSCPYGGSGCCEGQGHIPRGPPAGYSVGAAGAATGELKNSVRAEFPINSTRPLTSAPNFPSRLMTNFRSCARGICNTVAGRGNLSIAPRQSFQNSVGVAVFGRVSTVVLKKRYIL